MGRFVFEKDRRLALVGQLLVRAYVRRVQGLDLSAVVRTKGRKPVLRPGHGGRYPNGNFNVSHHGEWVVLAAEPQALVGVDVMRVELPGALSAEALFRDLHDTLTEAEWRFVRGEDGAGRLRRFYVLWTLKESHVKALGVGIAHDLRRLHFDVAADQRAALLTLDGRAAPRWRFDLAWLDAAHPVAVARGPATAADDEQRAAFASPADADAAWDAQRAAAESAPPFTVVSVPWLLSQV